MVYGIGFASVTCPWHYLEDCPSSQVVNERLNSHQAANGIPAFIVMAILLKTMKLRSSQPQKDIQGPFRLSISESSGS